MSHTTARVNALLAQIEMLTASFSLPEDDPDVETLACLAEVKDLLQLLTEERDALSREFTECHQKLVALYQTHDAYMRQLHIVEDERDALFAELQKTERQLQEAQQERNTWTRDYLTSANERMVVMRKEREALEAQCATQAAHLQKLDAYLTERVRFLTAVEPHDSTADVAKFHRLNELQQLRAALAATDTEP